VEGNPDFSAPPPARLVEFSGTKDECEAYAEQRYAIRAHSGMFWDVRPIGSDAPNVAVPDARQGNCNGDCTCMDCHADDSVGENEEPITEKNASTMLPPTLRSEKLVPPDVATHDALVCKALDEAAERSRVRSARGKTAPTHALWYTPARVGAAPCSVFSGTAQECYDRKSSMNADVRRWYYVGYAPPIQVASPSTDENIASKVDTDRCPPPVFDPPTHVVWDNCGYVAFEGTHEECESYKRNALPTMRDRYRIVPNGRTRTYVYYNRTENWMRVICCKQCNGVDEIGSQEGAFSESTLSLWVNSAQTDKSISIYRTDRIGKL
jgi:hypothetical protein